MSNIYVRDAFEHEHATIRNLTLAAYSEYADIMEPDGWNALRQALDDALSTDEPAERIVAEQHGRLVGSVLLFPPAVDAYQGAIDKINWPEVRLLAVDPESRGQGVAKALMDECLRRARQSGATHIGLHTSESMGIAMRMYEQMGFQRVPELDFQAPGGELVKAYRLEVGEPADNTSNH